MAFAQQEILELMNKVKPPYNISILNQKEVYQSLQNQEKFRKNLNEILEQRNFIEKELQNFSFVNKIYPSDANFLLIKVENADQLYNYLVDEKVIIRNRNKVVENCVRITIGNAEENQKLLQSLKNYQN
jgi:histidinol-phosphate aminotransferase